MVSYLIWKLIHVFAVVVFLGNIVTGLFWAAQAHKSGDQRLVAATFRAIILSDRWFTMPGVMGILISGVMMSVAAGFPILKTGWILWPALLFAVSGIVFGIWVAPAQRRIAVMMEAPDPDWQEYARAYKRWELWGLLAVLTPVAAAGIMVLKPPLPGL